ncbi:cell division protein FtsX [Lentzea sp. NBRC 105346]|uniref:permease-like cell division protein FtsX n=1 Tax=Lentzea sp. NBRC 105346 TaxID=3032205 RepID=UPI0024A3AC34|nr:permease-like cell division protein FtsX [Lentzea sp. NBRC 105346]GLZ30778.1 cell division protein FtsX [Lentzea sp. NBRC 105346]
MRTSFVFSEVITGLRRNVTMTIAMILTTAISLFLLGGGLLVVRTIDKMQANYQGKLEVSIVLTNDVSANDKDCAQQPCAGLRSELETTSGIDSVIFENRDKGYERFKQIFESQPELLKLARPEAIPATFRVKLADPERTDVIVQAFTGKPGVKSIDDQSKFLQRFFDALNGVRDFVLLMALIVGIASVLLISNTIQLSAFTRRTEVGIMRLVGATRWYTQLPFLIEAVVTGLVGALGGVALLAGLKAAFLGRVSGSLTESGIVPNIGYLDILVYAAPWMFLVAIMISAVTGYVTLRLYVRL